MTRAKRVEKASCWLWVGLLGCLASCGSTREVTTLSPSSSPISSTQIALPPADYAAVVAPVFRAPARRPEVEPGGSGSAVPSWSSAAVVGPTRATAPKAGTKLTRTQAGRIIDEAGQPLVGATVILKGTARGASTDADGSYSLEVPLGVNTFIFSYSGYQEEIAESRDGQPLTVTLLPLATKAKTKAKP
jgi:hypothetical protein